MRLIRLLIGMVLVFVLVFIAGLFLVPGEKIAQVAADEIERRTGREVQIGGEARFTLWPNLGVTVDTLRIANADWSENGPMFQAKSVTIGVDAAALISRDIKIRALHADAPEILLERNADGAANWDLSLSTPVPSNTSAPATNDPATTPQPASGGGRATGFTLDRAEIADASVYFINRQAGTEISQRGIDLILTYPEANGPADIDLTLRPAGEAVRLTGTLGDPMGLAGGDITSVALNIDLPGGAVSFDGRASTAPEAQGALALDISDTAALMSALGQSAPDLSEGLGRDLDLTAQVTLTKDMRLSLRDGSVASGSNTASLAADLTLDGDRPRLNAQVSAGPLDLRTLSGGSGGEGGGSDAAATGWSTAPIDASALGVMDGEIALTAPSVDLGTTKLGATRILVTIDRARAVASLREVQAFGGTVTGEVVANNRNGLSVGGEVRAGGIALKQALTELAGVSRFTGEASARVKFLAAGQSVAGIMNSLSGDGAIETGKGTIDGIDLDRLFRGGDPTGGTTIFDATNATFTMTDGNLRNEDLLMRLAGIEARGEGRIGLGPQDIDYLFTPVSLTARDGRGLALPVLIRGPWAGPKISVDLEKAIELNAAEERKALETQVREKVKSKVEQELGITQQDGESAEDAVKRTIEEEAKKGLLKLLNR